MANHSKNFRAPNRAWLWGLILIVAVIVAYSPVGWAGFIWDDDDHVTANPCIVGPLGLTQIWTTSHARICPLVLTTFWFEHALWGLSPMPYHLVNVLMHGAGAVLLWRVLRSLQVPGAWMGAALWALHPVQVETVAWITELKNTQSCFFYLLSILFFVKWLRLPEEKSGREWNYSIALLFAAMAMASKSSTVILPLILCMCAWWVEGRWHWRRLIGIAPIFLMSLLTSLVSMWTQNLEGANDVQVARSFPERLVTAGNVVWFYLGKLIWPHPLIFIYPRWQIDAGNALSYLPLIFAILAGVVLWANRNAWGRPWFFALGYYVVALLPVLGLVNHYFLRYSFVGDHFQYLAGMGPLALVGTALASFCGTAFPAKMFLRTALCSVSLVILGIISWQRTFAYESSTLLWNDTLAQNPACWMAHVNLSKIFRNQGREDDALLEYRKAVELAPNLAEAHHNYGVGLRQGGRMDEALAQFQKALEINPKFAEAHSQLGLTFAQMGKSDEAIAQLQKALEINPNFAEAHFQLGVVLAHAGKLDEAVAQFQKTLEINPDHAEARYNLGIGYLQKGSLDDAINQFHNALLNKPDYAEAYYNLGVSLHEEKRINEAIAQFQKALAINPNLAEAHSHLAFSYAQAGQVDDAIAQFRKALEINPGNEADHNNLGSALFLKGQIKEAIAQYQEAPRLKPDFAAARNNLAKAQAALNSSESPRSK